MADQKHKGPTPGPYHSAPSKNFNGEFVVLSSDGRVLAMCRHWPAENEANARLFAQAWAIPMLVEALEAMMEGNQPPRPDTHVWDCKNMPSDEACTKAAAALALLQEREGK